MLYNVKKKKLKSKLTKKNLKKSKWTVFMGGGTSKDVRLFIPPYSSGDWVLLLYVVLGKKKITIQIPSYHFDGIYVSSS